METTVGGNKYNFLGRETQAGTGYVDLMARFYDPKVPHFLTQDPVIEGQEGQSLYQYGWNNPILRSDPNGDCPSCPPGYNNPLQYVWQGFSQMAESAARIIDNFSIRTTSQFDASTKVGNSNAIVSNLTTSETRTNASANLSYIKTNNTNKGNATPLVSTTVTNETMVSNKQELNGGLASGSMKNSVSNSGKVTIEGKGEVQATKLLSVGVTASANTIGERKVKLDAGTSALGGTAKVFTQLTNSIKTFAAEIGIGYELPNKKTNTKITNTASIKYEQDKK